MGVKIDLTGKLSPEEVAKIVQAHLEKATGKKIQACYGTAGMKRNDTPYGADSYPEFTGFEFRFETEEI